MWEYTMTVLWKTGPVVFLKISYGCPGSRNEEAASALELLAS